MVGRKGGDQEFTHVGWDGMDVIHPFPLPSHYTRCNSDTIEQEMRIWTGRARVYYYGRSPQSRSKMAKKDP